VLPGLAEIRLERVRVELFMDEVIKPAKLKMHSPDLTAEKIRQISELLPNCVTESRGEDGSVRQAIDFDQLRQELSDHIVEGPAERYRLDWPGKREAILTANAPIAKTLRPCREESVDFDTTKNLFIEGDNLDALKLLQETYLGKVKLIYIDPPYNTGNDFVYEDDFAEGGIEYLIRSNQQDELGARLITNAESNGRFHSDWASMIFARLTVARNLLREDGVMFISIDDHEQANLRKICEQVFGEQNFVAAIVWQKRYVSNVTAQWLSDMHDYVLVFARDKDQLSFHDWKRTREQEAAYKNPDNDPRGVWRAQDLSASKPYSAGLFEIVGPTGGKFLPPPNRYWRCNEEQFNTWKNDGRIWWGVNQDARPMLKAFLKESERGITPHTWWEHEFAGHNKEATLELKELFSGNAPFSSPKPVKLLTRVLELATKSSDLVMDFFAGSGTFAEAVYALNAENTEQRRFIVVQVPEPLDPPSDRFASIAEITKERIRLAGAKVAEPNLVTKRVDTGFRVLKIDTSNMQDVYYTPDETQQGSLLDHVNNIKPDRTPEDLLFQVLLDWGVDLASPIASDTVDGKQVFFVDGNALAACFDFGLTDEFVKQIAERKPLRAVFRDASYSSDAAKINVEQIFKFYSPETEVRCL
jgi:adenine-specific DNA-methyltransferase